MTKYQRFLSKTAFSDLNIESPMVFISGPRQVGKTFLAQQFSSRYFNWDTPEVKKAYLKSPYFFRDLSQPNPVVIFDEIHKKRNWKKLMKGYYDSPDRQENFVVTGSGRFDVYRKGGDSLQGRYFHYTLFPLTLREIHNSRINLEPIKFEEWEPHTYHKLDDESLIKLGGFPEVQSKGTERYMRKWNHQYLSRLVKEDARDFSLIKHIDKLELLARLLPERVLSPLSYKSLSEDIEVSPITIKDWMRLLEQLYLGFLLLPFHQKIHRAIKKEKKWYFYQWSFCEDPSSRFENYIAVQLKCWCDTWTQQGYGRYELFYLRDQDRREVDFLITKNLKPTALFEVKSSPQQKISSLEYYTKKLKIPGFVIIENGPTTKRSSHIWECSSSVFFS